MYEHKKIFVVPEIVDYVDNSTQDRLRLSIARIGFNNDLLLFNYRSDADAVLYNMAIKNQVRYVYVNKRKAVEVNREKENLYLLGFCDEWRDGRFETESARMLLDAYFVSQADRILIIGYDKRTELVLGMSRLHNIPYTIK